MEAGAGDDNGRCLGARGVRRRAHGLGPGDKRDGTERQHDDDIHAHGLVLTDLAHQDDADDDHDHVVAAPAQPASCGCP